MNKLVQFFSIEHAPKLNLPISEQRKIWLKNFLKTYFMILLAYAAMYLLRNNIKAGSGMLKDQLGFTTTQLGQIGLAFSVAYGVGKTLLGYMACGTNAKRLLSSFLILAAIAVFIMGILLSVKNCAMGFLLLLWGFNGLFQSTGASLCFTSIARWTPRTQRGRWLSMWNISHNIGGAVAGIIALFGANMFFSGHVYGMFIFPAVIALVIGAATLFVGHDSPEEMGMESAETLFNEVIDPADVESNKLSKWRMFITYVLLNKWIWFISMTTVFVYVLRIGIDNWAPLYTKEMLNFNSSQQVNTIFYFEIGALVGSLLLGYISDLMHGRCGLVMICCFLLTFLAIFGYHNSSSVLMVNLSLASLGGLIFGPQVLTGISATYFVPKKAITVANGMLGTFSYLFGDSMAKIGLAVIADPKSTGLNIFGHVMHGWHDTFDVLYTAVICGIILASIVAYGEEKRIKKLAAAKSI